MKPKLLSDSLLISTQSWKRSSRFVNRVENDKLPPKLSDYSFCSWCSSVNNLQFHAHRSFGKSTHQDGSFLRLFSSSKPLTNHKSRELYDSLKTQNCEIITFSCMIFPLQLLHWYWKGVWLCTLIKGRHFILNWALIQSSSPLWIIGPKKCVSIPEKSLWVLSVYETLKPELEVKENVVIALQNYSFNCLVSILYKFTVLLKYPSSWKGLVESGL